MAFFKIHTKWTNVLHNATSQLLWDIVDGFSHSSMQVLDLGFNLIQFDEFFDVRTIFDEIFKKKLVKSQLYVKRYFFMET